MSSRFGRRNVGVLFGAVSSALAVLASPVAARAESALPVGQAQTSAADASDTRASAESVPPPVEAPKQPSEPESADRSVYVSISPLHLLLGVVEATAELKASRKLGLAAIGGIGSVKVDNQRVSVFEVGGQLVGYPVGHFDHGMQLGVEVLYAGASASTSSGAVSVAGTASGLAMGPFVGYKLATSVGFTFDVQGGIEYLAANAEATDSTGAKASAGASGFIPLLNLNAGWSF